MIIEHNLTTGKITEREPNSAELAQQKIDETAEATRQEAEAIKAADRAALLAKLGISKDEAKLLLS